MSADDIQIWTDKGLGRVHLNAPKRLNALSMSMLLGLREALNRWRHDDAIKAVAITGEGDRAFCAGGDIRFLRDARMNEGAEAAAVFYAEEYKTDWTVYHFPKPYIALMDGITMGGGCGVSINGDVRIATENTSLAMPETGIGLFPDVGATKFLPDLPGRTGLFLGLTGERIGAADCCHYGLATHYISRDRQEALLSELAAFSVSAGADQDIAAFLHEQCEAAPEDVVYLARQAEIDAIFAGSDVRLIHERMAADEREDWRRLADLMTGKCPKSLFITAEQLRRGADLSFDEAMVLEYRLAARLMAEDNFFEGVRAMLIDRDRNPRWDPPTIADVTDDSILAMFAPLPEGDLKLGWDA